MEKNDKLRFVGMIKIALILMIIELIISFFISFSYSYWLGIIWGAILGILGFISIIRMVEKIEFNTKTRQKVMFNYVLRYLFYIIMLIIGYKLGLNMITMLLGFLCMNIAIKVYIALEERGTFN